MGIEPRPFDPDINAPFSQLGVGREDAEAKGNKKTKLLQWHVQHSGLHQIKNSVTGDSVTGDSVTGDYVTGDSVTGDYVTGDSVTGDYVTGDSVTGDCISQGSGATHRLLWKHRVSQRKLHIYIQQIELHVYFGSYILRLQTLYFTYPAFKNICREVYSCHAKSPCRCCY